MKFSTVTPSYNGKEYLRKCILALEKSILKPEKIIVIDDASTDGTSEMVKSNFPQVEIIRIERNIGPTAARNRGAEKAEGDYIVFLDNDVLVRPGSIQNLIKFMEHTTDAGVAGGKLINEKGDKMWWNMGYKPNFIRDFLGRILDALLGENRFVMKFSLNYWNYNRTIRVDWVAETFIAVRKTLFDKLGGFDERFFMFFEGPDLSERMKKIGYGTYFVPNAVVDVLPSHTHPEQKRKKLWRKSYWFFYKKHYFGMK